MEFSPSFTVHEVCSHGIAKIRRSSSSLLEDKFSKKTLSPVARSYHSVRLAIAQKRLCMMKRYLGNEYTKLAMNMTVSRPLSIHLPRRLKERAVSFRGGGGVWSTLHRHANNAIAMMLSLRMEALHAM